MTGFLNESTWDIPPSGEIVVHLRRVAVISGKVLNGDGEALETALVEVITKSYQYGEVSLLSKGFAKTDHSGMYRVPGLAAGSYYVRASRDGYYTSLYPNSSVLTTAQSIRLNAGETRSDIDFRLQLGKRFSLAGQLIDGETGQLAAAAFLRAESADQITGTFVDGTIHDGHFQLEGMKPGRYFLRFDWVGPTNDVRRTVVLPFEMGQADQTGVILTALPRVTISGRLKPIGGTLQRNLDVYLQPADPAIQMAGAGADVADDGTFKITGAEAGMYSIEVHSGNAPQFYVRERDPIVVAGLPLTGVDLELDFSAGTISGHAVDRASSPLLHASVVLQSTDSKKRAANRYGYVYGAGVGGLYSITGIVPGEYLLFAWRGDDFLIGDPDLFAAASKYAVRVTVTPGGVILQDAIELTQ
jgi:carboxypeptidase family protein